MIILPNILPKKRNAQASTLPWKAVLAGMSCFAITAPPAKAQSVWMATPTIPLQPGAVTNYQTNQETQVFAPEEPAVAAPAETTPLRWGSVVLHPRLGYRFLYGNGIQSAPGQQHDTVVQQLIPGLLINAGNHWALDYTPTFSFYSAGGFRNTVDHSVYLGWGTVYEDWFLHASQHFDSTSEPIVQTAAQTDEKNYLTALGGTYQFNDKMSLDLGLGQELHFVGNPGSSANYQQAFSDWRNWSTMDWFNYEFWPRFNAGLGLGAGYNQQNGGPNAVYEQYQGRIKWRATDKISFILSGGLQDQQYLTGGAGDLLTPIFGGTIQYQPFEQTRLSLAADRSVSSSYFQNQTTEITSITADLNQRLLGKLHLDLSGGYNKTKYVASAAGLATGRTDDYYTFSARLTCPFLKRGTIAVLYQYGKNSSSQNGFASGTGAFAYSSSQIGFEIGYRY